MGEEMGRSGAGWLYRGVNDAPELSHDTIFQLLADRQRRDLLRLLAANPSNVIELEDLVSAMQSRHGESSDTARETYRIHFRHHHLPRLADAGVIDFDRRSEAVRYHGHPKIEAVLDLVDQW